MSVHVLIPVTEQYHAVVLPLYDAAVHDIPPSRVYLHDHVFNHIVSLTAPLIVIVHL